MSCDIPEQVYVDAARAYESTTHWDPDVGEGRDHPEGVLDLFVKERANQPAFRAAVESAYGAALATVPDGLAAKYGIRWTEPNGQVFVSTQPTLEQAREISMANAGHPKLQNVEVVQSWRTSWVPLAVTTDEANLYRVDTPNGERIAYLPPNCLLPEGWTVLGRCMPELSSPDVLQIGPIDETAR